MRKVAVIMGSWAHPRTTITFKALGSNYSTVVIAAKRCSVVGATDIGIPVRRLVALRDITRHIPKIRNRFRWGSDQYLFGFEKALEDVDVVVPSSATCFFAYQAARYCEKTGKPLVLQEQENIPFVDLDRSMYPRRSYVLSVARRIATLTERAKLSLILEGVPSEKIRVLRRGIDTELFHPRARESGLREKLGFTQDQTVILFAGRIVWSKGIWEFVHAAKLLLDDPAVKQCNPTFLIVSAGGKVAAVKERIRYLNISEHVKIMNSVPFDQMPTVYGVADIFVAPSAATPLWQEQWGLVISEAMATGTPVITTLSGAIPEVIGEAGVLVQPSDTYALLDALKRLVCDVEKRKALGEAGRARVVEECDWRTVGSRYADLIDEACAEGAN